MDLSDRIKGLAHIGLRVRDHGRAVAFYEQFGFRLLWGPHGPDRVSAMVHPSGLELNFIVNAGVDGPNVLMDVPEKHAGITHIALRIDSVAETEAMLSARGIAVSGRRGADPVQAVFIRDPDLNVIELAAD